MSSGAPESFDGLAILDVLVRHGVDFVVIGGFAASLHGSPYVTYDIDVTPRQDRDNFVRLSAALTELDARVRADCTEPLPFSHDGESLAGASIWNLSTKFGDLDISATPSGTNGYPDLRRDAVVVRIREVEFAIASIADIVRSKGAAGRDKDRLVLPVLRELAAEETRTRALDRRRKPDAPR
ncbi:MAG TPA: hypothetical protein VHV76_09035 [Mycobacteriales bacterium]|nr:hypothetical protein [Mycobacteriales bacterium]